MKKKITETLNKLDDKKNLLHTMHADFKWLFHVTVAMLGERRVSEVRVSLGFWRSGRRKRTDRFRTAKFGRRGTIVHTSA